MQNLFERLQVSCLLYFQAMMLLWIEEVQSLDTLLVLDRGRQSHFDSDRESEQYILELFEWQLKGLKIQKRLYL